MTESPGRTVGSGSGVSSGGGGGTGVSSRSGSAGRSSSGTVGVGVGRGVGGISTTIRRRTPDVSPGEIEGVVGIDWGGTGRTISEDFSTKRCDREVFSMTTGIGGVTIGGISAGVGIFSTTAGAGAPGPGRSVFASGVRRDE